jgi:lysophospholipase L1-like esterase
VKYLIVLEGINDIQRATAREGVIDSVTAAQLIQAYAQVIERAHAHGIKVIGATLTPYGGSHNDSQAGEEMINQINRWIRTSGRFDAVIDFGNLLQDPTNPAVMKREAGSDDQLHPGDSGYKLMGESIDLKLFEK